MSKGWQRGATAQTALRAHLNEIRQAVAMTTCLIKSFSVS